MDSYFIDRTHKRLIRVDEFQHHGIIGQRWGVITRNVGVNYIPINKHSDSITITYGKNRKAVNEIFNTMTNTEKIHLAGEAGSSRVPKEYVSAEEYGPKGTSIENVIIYQGKTPVSFCDVWANSPGRGYICIGTRGGAEYRGKGYASKALSEAIKLFKDNPNLNELDYYPHQGNASSINLAKKFGFKEFENNEYFVGLGLFK